MENRLTFGLDAAGYRRYRPTYPRELYEFLAAQAPARDFALDCATGNGQAAVDLARYFDSVSAFDSSAAQIEMAIDHPRVQYAVADAESLPYPAGRFALITIAQAAHWFDLPAFYTEVKRVGVRDCVVAVWGYSYCTVDPSIDAVVDEVLLRPIAPFWARGEKVITGHYREIEFPFAELEWPGFASTQSWSRHDYMQYLRTWSSVRKHYEKHGTDLVGQLDAELIDLWPAPDVREVRFEFVGRVGRAD